MTIPQENADYKFWADKKVLIVSPTSFLGSWTALSLKHFGASVFGFGEAAASSQNLFDLANLGQGISMTYGDPRDERIFREVLDFSQAEIVLHLGESGLLHDNSRNSLELISRSVVGTANLMELLRDTATVRAVVVGSSDKVYERNESNNSLLETDKIAAQGVLPTAKLCSELIALSYRKTFFAPEKYNKHKIALATARMGAPIGGGDFAEGSLLAEAVQSLLNKSTMSVRNPQSVRPWIHVLDQVAGILKLAEKLIEKGPKLAPTYNLGASEQASVEQVLRELNQLWGGQESEMLVADKTPSLHGSLNSEKALQDLGWQPRLGLQQSLLLTSDWYKAFYQGSLKNEHDLQVASFF